jgi:hypothetical protein
MTMSRSLKILILAALAALTFTACHHSAGSREFVPGRGWVPN